MKAKGLLKTDKIIIERAKDVGRFYNKSHLGKTISGNNLELNILETAFLIGEEKIRVFSDDKELDFEEIIKIGSKKIQNFVLKYLVFKDLRNRGQTVITCDDLKVFSFYDFNKKFFVATFSENDYFDLKKTDDLVKKASEKNAELWLAIVDDEGDITYYTVYKSNIKGENKNFRFKKNRGVLSDSRIMIPDEGFSKNLFEKEFFGKPFNTGLQLSFIEGNYLLENDFIELYAIDNKKISRNDFLNIAKEKDIDFDEKSLVYNDLKKRKLIVKTGFKFGSHFRCYKNNPNTVHAESLVHIVDKNYNVAWSNISRSIRLAHSVNKEIIFARVFKDNVEYVGFGRLRP